jgi:ABC-type transport system substrate-binding protein
MNEKQPIGAIYVVDRSPLNWIYTLFNTMEEAVRTDHLGRIIPSLAKSFTWIDDTTLELQLRKGVRYHNNEHFAAKYILFNYNEQSRWIAPHPPGTWLNFPDGTTVEAVDSHTVRYNFPKPDGLALGKLRANHYANFQFWQQLGFGYAKLGTGEGHW